MHLQLYLALLSVLTWRSDCDLTDLEWEEILPDLKSLCPTVDFCGRRGSDSYNSTDEPNPCCLGCSCDVDCHDNDNCCFQDEVIRLGRIIDCREPTIGSQTGLPKYLFVTKPPTNGCMIPAQGSNQVPITCSPDITVAPWGNFDPVFSKSLNKNFKNEPCALCHGADKDELEHWLRIITYQGSGLSFAATMADFFETFKPSEMTIIFDPPNSQSKAVDKRCYYKEIDTCSPRTIEIFDIPLFLKLDRPSIIDACVNGTRAIYIWNPFLAYKNMYCAICNMVRTNQHGSLLCYNQAFDSKSIPSAFSLLLTGTSLTSIGRAQKEKKTTQQCFQRSHVLNETDIACVPVFCPTLQIRSPTGVCGYPLAVMEFQCLSLVLHLRPDQGRHGAISNITGTDLVAAFNERNPWSDDWLIAQISVLPDTNMTTEFQVKMLLKERRTNIRRLVSQIARKITHKWTSLAPDQAEVNYTQRFMEFNMRQEVIPKYTKQRVNTRCGFEIGKTFFCHQVELQSNEFTLELISSPLYLTHTDQVLYPYEYTLGILDDGSIKVRVCLEDSGYIRANMTGNAEGVFYGSLGVSLGLIAIVWCVFVNDGCF